MFTVKPDFYDDFKCTAGACTDNCCIGWEIDVDESTLEKYNSLQSSLGDEIRSGIIKSEDGSYCFRLSEKESCPFLDDENLCRLITESGDCNLLCDICREHPRFYEWFTGFRECGLGLCCEEVCRILLADEKPFSLLEESDGEKINAESPEEVAQGDLYIFLSAFRERLFELLFSRDMNFEEKMAAVLTETEALCGDSIKIRNYKNSIELYKKTEPIDEKWTLYINALSDEYDNILSVENKFNAITNGDMLYSKILAYILYRHLSKAVFDRSIKERVCFCVESVRFIYLCDMKTFYEKGELTLRDRIDNLKNWSKQIEYSEENTDLLIYGEW